MIEKHKDIKPGDLVSVAVYESPRRRGILVCSPNMVKYPNQPGLHNSKSRTRVVSALVVESQPAKQGLPFGRHRYPNLLKVVIDDKQVVIPLGSVIEVLNHA